MEESLRSLSCCSGFKLGLEASLALKKHVAQNALAIALWALPMTVQQSQEEEVLLHRHPVVLKLVCPGQRQILLQHRQCCWLQGEVDTNLVDIEAQMQCEDPNPTKQSLALVVPCSLLLSGT